MLSTLAIFSGCAFEEPEETVAEHSAASSIQNTLSLNGDTINGGGVNGGGVNGGGVNGGGVNGGGVNGGGVNGGGVNGGGVNGTNANLVGLTFDLTTASGVTASGAPIEHVWVENGTFKAIRGDGAALSGQALVGAELNGKLDNGESITLRLDALESFTSAVGTPLPRYLISYTGPNSSTLAHVCGKNDAGEPIKTIPLTGRWNFEQGVPEGGSKEENSTLVSFACQGFALYKCIDYGYPPWKKVNGIRLNNHHQACVRMLRADYCGDGRSWTVNGTIINMYDNLGIQLDTETWSIEAEWDIEGARCLSHQRIQSLDTVPDCTFERSPAACGNPAQWGATLHVSEAP